MHCALIHYDHDIKYKHSLKLKINKHFIHYKLNIVLNSKLKKKKKTLHPLQIKHNLSMIKVKKVINTLTVIFVFVLVDVVNIFNCP